MEVVRSYLSQMDMSDTRFRVAAAVGVVGIVGCLYKNYVFGKWRREILDEIGLDSKVADTKQGPLEYQIKGEAPYILYFHGTPGGCNVMNLVDDLCPGGEFGAICVSRPGYLRSPLATGPSYEETADAIASLLDKLNIDKVVAHAISGGGPPAVQFAVRHPAKVRGLMLSCAISGPKNYSKEVAPTWLVKMLMVPSIAYLQMWVVKNYPETVLREAMATESTFSAEDRTRLAQQLANDPQKVAFYNKLVASALPVEDLTAGFFNEYDRFATANLPLQQIQCPTLICHGKCDKDVPFAQAENAAEKIPNSETHFMEKGWHLLWLSEGADDMVNRQMQFLRALPA